MRLGNAVTFGSSHLRATNEQLYQKIFCEWIGDGNGADDGTGADNPVGTEEDGIFGDDEEDAVSSVSSESAESTSDTGERLKSLIDSGTSKGKIFQMMGPRASPHPVPLAKWTPLVKGVVGELVGELGHGCS